MTAGPASPAMTIAAASAQTGTADVSSAANISVYPSVTHCAPVILAVTTH